jgi:hypothetical protein
MSRKRTEKTICHDCKVKPGALHKPGCDVERCPNCGFQLCTCGCSDAEIEAVGRMVWTGRWPGEAECEEYGFWCRQGEKLPGALVGQWTPCHKDDPGARPHLNRLVFECDWDKTKKRFVLKKR